MSLLLGLGLVIAAAAPVAADTVPNEADLGVEGVTITGATVNTKTGVATVSGTVECSQDVEGFVWVDVRQNVGRFFTIGGDGGAPFSCLADDGSAAFSVEVHPYQGKFGGGAATANAFAEAAVCEGEEEDAECLFDFESSGPVSIRLRGGGR